jgi:hypothetical protein
MGEDLMPSLITKREAAEVLGLSERSVERLADELAPVAPSGAK